MYYEKILLFRNNCTMETQLLLPDSINTITQTIHVLSPEKSQSWFDVIYNGITIVCTLLNVILVFIIYKLNDKKADVNSEKQRKMTLFHTLILNYNIEYFYKFFSSLEDEVDSLKSHDLAIEQKTAINEKILVLASKFRRQFIDAVNAIDSDLYNKIMLEVDEFTDDLTNDIFDEGINLSHLPKFEELITTKIFATKTNLHYS